MMMPVFMGSIDQSILASSLPTISRGVPTATYTICPGVITSYLIAATTLTPLYGKFADIHGRRASLMIALGITTWSVLSSARGSDQFADADHRPASCAGLRRRPSLIWQRRRLMRVLGDIAPPRNRAKYYAYFSIAFTSAGACGPAVGGWICQHLHWSLIFLWKFPFCLIAGVLAWNVLRRLPRYERPHRLDVISSPCW